MTLVELYKQMSDHTAPECAKSCRVPHSCCDAMYCEAARDWAKEKYGITLKETGHKTLPFMGPNGCTVEPHLRPMCTMHTCEINSFGAKLKDEKWTQEYFRLRDLIEVEEYRQGD